MVASAVAVMVLGACGGGSNAVTTASGRATPAQDQSSRGPDTQSSSGSTPELVVPDGYQVYLVGAFRSDVDEQARSAFVERLLSNVDRQTSPYAAQYRADAGRLELSWPTKPSDGDLSSMQSKLDESGLFVSVSRVNG
jgi:hypothetical protein